MDAVNKRTQPNMLEGSVFRGLMRMTWPIMLMNVLQSLLSVIDMTVLGQMADDSAVGSVGACGMLISLFTGLFIGIATGSNVAAARHIGERRINDAKRAVGTSLWISLFSGVILLIAGNLLARTVLIWNNCPATLLDNAALYFKLYFAAAPFILLYNFCASILRATGDTKRPMLYLILAGVLKIALNIVLILLLRNGIVAVGVSTILSNAVSGGLSLWALLKRDKVIGFRLSELCFDAREAKKIFFVGVPAGLQMSLYSLANVVIFSAVNTFGEAATKGISIANQFDGIVYQIAISPAYATVSYVSQNAGARNVARVRRSVALSMLITVAFGASFGALSALLSPRLASLMSSDPQVITYAGHKMLLISSTYFIAGLNNVMSATLQGLEKPIVPTAGTLLYMCVLRLIWVYFIFPLWRHLTFLYLVWPIGWVLAILTSLCFYFPAIAKLKANAPPVPAG